VQDKKKNNKNSLRLQQEPCGSLRGWFNSFSLYGGNKLFYNFFAKRLPALNFADSS
jgi:hypothetical protein